MYIIPMDAGHCVIMRMMYLNLRSSVHRRLTFDSTSFQYVCRPPSPRKAPTFDGANIRNFFNTKAFHYMLQFVNMQKSVDYRVKKNPKRC